MSERVQILGLLLAFCSTVFTGVMAYFMARLNDKQDRARDAAEQVKRTLAQNQTHTNGKLDVVVRRLDGQKTSFLKTIAAAMRVIANDHPGDTAAADAANRAERDLAEHEAELAKSDAASAASASQ